MSRSSYVPIRLERQEDGGVVPTILRELEREAMHLTRRDGKRRHVVQWADEPPMIDLRAVP